MTTSNYNKNSIIKLVYLYLSAFIGLILVVIGSIQMIDLILKVFIFQEAEKTSVYQPMPPVIPIRTLSDQDNITKEDIDSLTLTKEEKIALQSWLEDYKNWQENISKIDYLKAERERKAANALAFVLVGLPIYLYHCKLVKKEKITKAEI